MKGIAYETHYFTANFGSYNLKFNAIAFLNKIYNDEFYLSFEMEVLPVSYSGPGVDSCSHGASSPCGLDCHTDCQQHHKNVNRIAKEALENLWERNSVVVLWSDVAETGYYCYGMEKNPDGSLSNSVHLGVRGEAVTPPHGGNREDHIDFVPFVLVTSIQASGKTRTDKMAVILAHEIAHTLGLQEIYMNWYNDDALTDHQEGDGTICIMAEYSSLTAEQIVEADMPLCEYCIEKLQSEIDDDVYEEKDWEACFDE